jgi:hypothetical protein
VLGTATCALALAIGRRAGGERAGLVAAWLLALDPTWVFTTNLVASENLFVPLVALGLWLGGGAQTTRRFAAAGWVLGLAALVRAIGLCLPVVLAVWAWRRSRVHAHAAGRPTPGGRVGRPGRIWAAAVLAGAALAIAPWTVRNAVVTGTPALVCFGGGLNFYFGHNDGPLGYRPLAQTPLAGLGDAAAIDRRGYELGRDMLFREPLGFFSRGVHKVGALFAPPGYAMHANTAVEAGPSETVGADAAATPPAPARHAKERLLHGPLTWLASIHMYALLAATLAVLFVPSRRRRVPAEIQLWTWVWWVWIAAYVVFWAQPRFRHPLDLPMALIAACGLLAPHAVGAAASGAGFRRRRGAVSGSRPITAGRRG